MRYESLKVPVQDRFASASRVLQLMLGFSVPQNVWQQLFGADAVAIILFWSGSGTCEIMLLRRLVR